MHLVIRHAKKGPDGNLTPEGEASARVLGDDLRNKGFKIAWVAPNARAEQTAQAAGLKIVNHIPALGIPDRYEEYINKAVVARMLEQPGKPWEKSFTKAVLEDPLYEKVFWLWGDDLVRVLDEMSPEQVPTVLIGSSPIIELGYLAFCNSKNWRDFPRCRELEGFILEKTEYPERRCRGIRYTCRWIFQRPAPRDYHPTLFLRNP